MYNGCLKFYAKYLSFQDLVSLAHVSKDVRGGLYRTSPNPWQGKVISINLSAESLEGLLTCRYPIKGNPVEIVFDARNPSSVPGNISACFKWLTAHPPAHLTLNFDDPSSDEDRATLYSFVSYLTLMKDKSPKIPSLCLKNASFEMHDNLEFMEEGHSSSDNTISKDIFVGLATLFPHVTHLTLENFLDHYTYLCEPEQYFRKLVNLESITIIECDFDGGVSFNLENYPWGSTLKSVTIKDTDCSPSPFTRYSEYNVLSAAGLAYLENLVLDKSYTSLDEDEIEEYVSQLAIRCKNLKSLLIKGFPFEVKDFIDSEGNVDSDRIQEIKSLFQTKFAHLGDGLILEF